MGKPDQQQIGITNNIEIRIGHHKNNGWEDIDKAGPFPGQQVIMTETLIKKWLKNYFNLVQGTTENWHLNELEINSLDELFYKSSIKSL